MATLLTPGDMMQVLELETLFDLMKQAFEAPDGQLEQTRQVSLQLEPRGGAEEAGQQVYLQASASGERLASMNAALLQDVTRGVVTAVATGLLARADAARVTLVGTTSTSAWAFQSLGLVRHVRRVSVHDSVPFRAGPFVRRLAAQTTAKLVAMDSLADAVMDAEVIVMASGSAEPLLFSGMVPPGVHINALPAGSLPVHAAGADLDEGLLLEARLFSDDPNDAGSHSDGTLGDVIRGDAPGRIRTDDTTIYLPLGLAQHERITAWHLYEKALEHGVGQ